MKLAKTVCVLLLSVFVLTTNVSALDLDIEREGSSIIITNSNPHVELTITRGDEFFKFNLVSAAKTIILFRSDDPDCREMRIKGFSNSTGEITTLSKKEYRILSLLAANLNFKFLDAEQAKFLSSTLNLLISWPQNLPVFVSTNPKETLYITSEYEPVAIENESLAIELQSTTSTSLGLVPITGKELAPLPSASDSICDYWGQRIKGHILYFGKRLANGDQQVWTEDFSEMVGYKTASGKYAHSCFGRCGIGCSGYFDGKEIYTQRCFNHDGCVTWNGYIAKNCNCMFMACLDDYYSAPVCDNHPH